MSAPRLPCLNPDGGQELGRFALIQSHGYAYVTTVTQWPTDQPFEAGCGGVRGKEPRRPLDQGRVDANLAATAFISSRVNPVEVDADGPVRLASSVALWRTRSNSSSL